ncbi:MAG: 2TM domain-containing protein [Candidatus Latescibacteria bacterium]|nr:2TM domain-containing protein [Candidatus Latescibacterota bacterium]
MDEKHAYESARKFVEARVDFFVHFLIYLFVNGVLFVINYRFSRGTWWFIFPLLFWGIGIFAHFLSVFLLSHSVKERWIRKKAQEIMQHHKPEDE